MRPYIVQNMPGRGQGGKGMVWDIQECCSMQNGPKRTNIYVYKNVRICLYLKVQDKREGDINLGQGGHEGRVSIMTHLAK